MSEKIKIRHRDTNAVLFECEAPADLSSGLRMRHALEKATQARANLARANLVLANLDRANLAGANLAGANLARASLDGANLAGANLDRANLDGASLDGANLDRANLARASLDGANLDRANLARANLDGANLAGAKFGDGVKAERGIRQVLGLRWPVTIFDNHMRIGCQLHSLADWAAFTKRDIVEMDGTDALLFWRRHKAMLLALAGHNEVAA